MNAEIAAKGVVICRGALGGNDLETLRRLAREGYDGVESGRGPAHTRDNVAAWGGLGMTELPQIIDAEPALSNLLKAVTEIGSRVIGETAKNIVGLSQYRRHVRPATNVPWHIDADGAGTAGYDPCFNVWLPLVPVGWELPSLDFIVGSHLYMRHVPFLDPQNAARSSRWLAEHLPRAEVITPVLSPGDAVIFDHYTLYRTQPMPGHGERISGEFRITLQ